MQGALSVMQVHKRENPNSKLLCRVSESCNETLKTGLESGESTQVLHTLSFLKDAAPLFATDEVLSTTSLLLSLRTHGGALVTAQSCVVLTAIVKANCLPATFIAELLEKVFVTRPLASSASDTAAPWALLIAEYVLYKKHIDMYLTTDK
jgi:hypothetical protein